MLERYWAKHGDGMTEFMGQKKLREAEPQIVQAWPAPQDYNESVQNPDSSFLDADLQTAAPELNFLGLPKTASGNFASVYHLFNAKSDWAVRCFLHPPSDQEQRYKAISGKFSEIDASYLAGFEYVSDGIKVASKHYPILKMEWIQGQSLLQYIEEHLHDSQKLKDLASSFKEAACSLHRHGIAHGDLQHGNIIVESTGQIRIVDYDSCYVPELAGKISNELGHSNYQHPERSFADFNENMDNFSAWLIYISILSLAEDPSLWQTLGAGHDCLLFKKHDLLNPLSSRAFHTLENHHKENVRQNARFLRATLAVKPSQVPSLAAQNLEFTELPDLQEIIDPKSHSRSSSYQDWQDSGIGDEESVEAKARRAISNEANIAKPKLSYVPPAMRAAVIARSPRTLGGALLVSAASISLVFGLWYTLNTKVIEMNAANKANVPKASDHWQEFDKNVQQLMADGMNAFKNGDYQKAQGKFSAALKETDKLGYYDVRQLAPLSSMAELYRLQGKYQDAEQLLEKTVKIAETYPDEYQICLAKALNELASIYKAEGKFSESKVQYAAAEKVTAASCAKALQSEGHIPDALANVIAQTKNGDADLHRLINDYARAEVLCKEALKLRTDSEISDSAEIAESLCTLGKIYSSQGKYQKAEPLYKDAISNFEKQFGVNDPHLANALSGLATLYVAQGKYASAQPIYERELKILKNSFGEMHPLTAEALNGLAAIASARKDYQNAERLLCKALAIREKAFGSDHIICADSLNKIAELYRSEKKFTKSVTYYKQAMAIYTHAPGNNSAGIAALLNNMGLVCLEKGEYSEATGLFEHARTINEKNYGKEHPIVMTNLNNIATSLQAQGKYSQAEQLYKKSLELREKTLGSKHQDVAQSLQNLATLYRLQGRNEEAAELNKRALAITGGSAQYSLGNKII